MKTLNRELNQEQVERLFQTKDISEDIVNFEEQYLHTYRQDITDILSKYDDEVTVLDAIELNYDILSVMGNPATGIAMAYDHNNKIVPARRRLKPSNFRDIEFISLVKGLIKKSNFSHYKQYRAKVALDILAYYDTILFDINQKNVLQDNGEWRHLSYFRVEFKFDDIQGDLTYSLPPMIEQPIDWETNKAGGYILNTNSSPILNKGDKTQPKKVLVVLNKLQSYSWVHSINIQREYDWTLAKMKETTDDELLVAKKTNDRFNSTEVVYDFLQGRDIYFAYKFDSRGRTYSEGYDANPQGNQAKKGSLRPTSNLQGQNEILTERGLTWLKRMVANHYGNDKFTHKDQELWFDNNIAYIIKDFNNYFDQADEPFQFKLAVEDYMSYLKGQPVSNYAHLDCSNQALQIYGIVTKDEATCRLGNLSGSSIRLDGYQIVADELNKAMGSSIFTRKDAKKPMMKSLYGYTKGADDLMAILTRRNIAFDADTFRKTFDKAMRTVAKGAMSTMDTLQTLNKASIDDYYWTLPDGFQVKYSVKSKLNVDASINTRSGKHLHIIDIVKVYQGSAYSRGIAPNIIHSIDGYIFRELVRRLPYAMVGIHDDYGIHYNHVDEMVTEYKTILKELLNSNILQDIITEIGTQSINVIKSDTLTEAMIDNSHYALS